MCILEKLLIGLGMAAAAGGVAAGVLIALRAYS
jgi:hypothetical protein